MLAGSPSRRGQYTPVSNLYSPSFNAGASAIGGVGIGGGVPVLTDVEPCVDVAELGRDSVDDDIPPVSPP